MDKRQQLPQHGNRYSPGTSPLRPPISPSPNTNHRHPLYQQQRPVRNPFVNTHSLETLESAFAGLHVTPRSQQPLHSSFLGSSLNDHGIAGQSFLDQRKSFNLQLSDISNDYLGLLDYGNTVLGSDNQNGFHHDSTPFLQRNRNGFLRDSINQSVSNFLRGNIVPLAKDQKGCRILQMSINEMSKEEIEMVFMEVIDCVGQLVLDPFGTYVVQKLVEVCTEEQRTRILLMLTKTEFQLVGICLSMHGTRAVQKLLENLTTQQQISLVMSALSPGAVALTKDMNGHHVIQHCLKHFSQEDNRYLLNEVTNNCYAIATDKSGCCVLQQCVEYCQGEPRDRLVAEIISNALHLAEDRYGNYVVQHMLGLRVPQITTNLLNQLKGSYTALSCNKYGSNVVEKCLLETGEQHPAAIIMELLRSRNVGLLLLDPYGNYVIQSALSVSKVSSFVHSCCFYPPAC
ncbi:PUF domain-containing protein [Cephalotus follicularis]|uniref:PUF domain-containing protein n=1 Tax=Cephalotus follicularis TaxID=3775 RepID=A0A1Q3CWD1_CEPFO|nr:PUF domain-containing protein [Cephalotus follicularis]